MGFILGFFFGILSSFLASIVYDHITKAKLVCRVDKNRSQTQPQGHPPCEFYHVIVKNDPALWPIGGRKPAWDCKATLEIVDNAGTRLLPEVINGRWASQPEPVVPISNAGIGTGALDFGRLVLARKITVHSHDDQSLSIAVKYENSPDCHLFSNESYLYPRWENPSWKLGPGSHRLRISLLYERPAKPRYYWLHNKGMSRDDLTLEAE